MPGPTKRSAEERGMYYTDRSLPRTNDNIKVTKLEPPDRFRDHPEKLDCWNFLCTDLAGRQLLSPSYFQSLVILVDNIAAYNEYVPMLEGSGPLIPMLAKDGASITGYKENPLFSIVKRTEQAINKMCEKFGLNPRDAVYTTNPDIKTQAIEAQVQAKTKGITYFSS